MVPYILVQCHYVEFERDLVPQPCTSLLGPVLFRFVVSLHVGSNSASVELG